MTITNTITITIPSTNPLVGDQTITFEPISREDYLAQRKAWRAEYAMLSQRIRETKHKMKDASRKGDFDAAAIQTMTRNSLRDMATAMLEERRIMKLKAQASYLNAREARLAA